MENSTLLCISLQAMNFSKLPYSVSASRQFYLNYFLPSTLLEQKIKSLTS